MAASLPTEKEGDLCSLVDYWLGDWLIHREVVAHEATMEGVALFQRSLQKNGLDYREEGDLVLQKTGQIFHATRRYYFQCQNDSVTVFFADGQNKGKVFQNLKPSQKFASSPTLSGTHMCSNDRYDTTYEIVDSSRFIVTHRVEGPIKNYTSTTFYFRSPQTR